MMYYEHKKAFRRIGLLIAGFVVLCAAFVVLLAGDGDGRTGLHARSVFATSRLCEVGHEFAIGRYATIQSAVNNSSCDTVFVFRGIYTETVLITRSLILQGDSTVPRQLLTILNANHMDTAIVVSNTNPLEPIQVEIEKIQIINGGPATGCNTAGGIYNNGGNVNMIKTRVLNGICQNGAGGIRNLGSLTTDLTEINDNLSNYAGGGILNSGLLYMLNTTLHRNTVVSTNGNVSSPAAGGGLYNTADGTVNMRASTVISNAAPFGGGIASSGVFSAANVTLALNVAPQNATGQHQGAGLLVSGGQTEIFYSLAYNNNYANAASATLEDGPGANVTVVSGTVHLNSTGLHRTAIAGQGSNCTGPVVDAGRNLDSDGSCGVGPATNLQLSPAGLADNAPPPITGIDPYVYVTLPSVKPLQGSLMLDEGDPTTCSQNPLLAQSDEYGVLRGVLGGVIGTDSDGDGFIGCDIGPIELGWYAGPTATPRPLTNLLQNGDFADPSLSSWSIPGTAFAITGTDGVARIDGVGQMDQVFATTPNRRYYVSGWLRINQQYSASPNGGLAFLLTNPDVSFVALNGYYSATNSPIDTWTQVSFNFWAKSTQTRFTFRAFGDGLFNADVDNLIVSPYPISNQVMPTAARAPRRVFVPVIQRAPINLLQNGDFAANTLDGWTNHADSDASTGMVHMNQSGWIDQLVTTVPGKQYAVSARIRINRQLQAPTNYGIGLIVSTDAYQSLAASIFLNEANSPVGEWTSVSATFTAATEQTRLTYRNLGDGLFDADADNFLIYVK